MKKLVAIVISVLIIIGFMVVGLISIVDEKQNSINSDSIKFKEEYEALNGKYYEEYDLTVSTINIDKDNPIKYLTDDTILKHLTEGTNIVYFGFSECGWCRRVVPVLFEFAKNNKIETIYYYNFLSLRNAYEANKNDEKVKLYENIINILDENLEKTYDENSTHPGSKRLSAPDVYFIKDGVIVGHNYKLVESYTNYNQELTSAEKEELLNIYQSNYDKMFANVCFEEAC